MKHSEYVEIIRNSATEIAIKVFTRVLLQEVPFLFWGPFGPLMKILISKVVTKAFAAAEMLAFFKYIDVRVDKQGKAFFDAIMENKKAQESGTEEEKKYAENNLINAFKSFVKLSN